MGMEDLEMYGNRKRVGNGKRGLKELVIDLSVVCC